MRKILELCRCPRQIIKKISKPTYDDIRTAITKNQGQKISLLVSEGAPLSQKGESAMHYSVMQENIQMLKYLYEEFPQLVDERNQQGDTPLMLAIFNKKQELFQYLLPISNLNSRDSNGNTPFIIACANGLTHLVKEMLTYSQLNVTAKNFEGQTALHRACYFGQIQVIKILMYQTPLKFIHNDKKGNNSLHLACMGISITTVQLIIARVKNSQQLMVVNKEGKKPLECMVDSINKVIGKNNSVNLDVIEQKIYHNISLPINL